VSEADAAALPSYRTYEVGERFFRPLVELIGGFAVHNAEVLAPLDGQSFILAPNHRSNWDSIIIGLALTQLPQLTAETLETPLQPRAIHYMAKETLWRVPGVRDFVESCGAFRVERGRGTGLDDDQMALIDFIISKRGVLGIYPEGHRNREAEDLEAVRLEKFHNTFAFLAIKYGLPIVPTGIYGPAGHGRKLPRTLVFGEPIYNEQLDPADPAFKSRKYALNDQTHARIDTCYQNARQLYVADWHSAKR